MKIPANSIIRRIKPELDKLMAATTTPEGIRTLTENYTQKMKETRKKLAGLSENDRQNKHSKNFAEARCLNLEDNIYWCLLLFAEYSLIRMAPSALLKQDAPDVIKHCAEIIPHLNPDMTRVYPEERLVLQILNVLTCGLIAHATLLSEPSTLQCMDAVLRFLCEVENYGSLVLHEKTHGRKNPGVEIGIAAAACWDRCIATVLTRISRHIQQSNLFSAADNAFINYVDSRAPAQPFVSTLLKFDFSTFEKNIDTGALIIGELYYVKLQLTGSLFGKKCLHPNVEAALSQKIEEFLPLLKSRCLSSNLPTLHFLDVLPILRDPDEKPMLIPRDSIIYLSELELTRLRTTDNPEHLALYAKNYTEQQQSTKRDLAVFSVRSRKNKKNGAFRCKKLEHELYATLVLLAEYYRLTKQSPLDLAQAQQWLKTLENFQRRLKPNTKIYLTERIFLYKINACLLALKSHMLILMSALPETLLLSIFHFACETQEFLSFCGNFDLTLNPVATPLINDALYIFSNAAKNVYLSELSYAIASTANLVFGHVTVRTEFSDENVKLMQDVMGIFTEQRLVTALPHDLLAFDFDGFQQKISLDIPRVLLSLNKKPDPQLQKDCLVFVKLMFFKLALERDSNSAYRALLENIINQLRPYLPHIYLYCYILEHQDLNFLSPDSTIFVDPTNLTLLTIFLQQLCIASKPSHAQKLLPLIEQFNLAQTRQTLLYLSLAKLTDSQALCDALKTKENAIPENSPLKNELEILALLFGQPSAEHTQKIEALTKYFNTFLAKKNLSSWKHFELTATFLLICRTTLALNNPELTALTKASLQKYQREVAMVSIVDTADDELKKLMAAPLEDIENFIVRYRKASDNTELILDHVDINIYQTLILYAEYRLNNLADWVSRCNTLDSSLQRDEKCPLPEQLFTYKLSAFLMALKSHVFVLTNENPVLIMSAILHFACQQQHYLNTLERMKSAESKNSPWHNGKTTTMDAVFKHVMECEATPEPDKKFLDYMSGCLTGKRRVEASLPPDIQSFNYPAFQKETCLEIPNVLLSHEKKLTPSLHHMALNFAKINFLQVQLQSNTNSKFIRLHVGTLDHFRDGLAFLFMHHYFVGPCAGTSALGFLGAETHCSRDSTERGILIRILGELCVATQRSDFSPLLELARTLKTDDLLQAVVYLIADKAEETKTHIIIPVKNKTKKKFGHTVINTGLETLSVIFSPVTDQKKIQGIKNYLILLEKKETQKAFSGWLTFSFMLAFFIICKKALAYDDPKLTRRVEAVLRAYQKSLDPNYVPPKKQFEETKAEEKTLKNPDAQIIQKIPQTQPTQARTMDIITVSEEHTPVVTAYDSESVLLPVSLRMYLEQCRRQFPHAVRAFRKWHTLKCEAAAEIMEIFNPKATLENNFKYSMAFFGSGVVLGRNHDSDLVVNCSLYEAQELLDAHKNTLKHKIANIRPTPGKHSHLLLTYENNPHLTIDISSLPHATQKPLMDLWREYQLTLNPEPCTLFFVQSQNRQFIIDFNGFLEAVGKLPYPLRLKTQPTSPEEIVTLAFLEIKFLAKYGDFFTPNADILALFERAKKHMGPLALNPFTKLLYGAWAHQSFKKMIEFGLLQILCNPLAELFQKNKAFRKEVMLFDAHHSALYRLHAKDNYGAVQLYVLAYFLFGVQQKITLEALPFRFTTDEVVGIRNHWSFWRRQQTNRAIPIQAPTERAARAEEGNTTSVSNLRPSLTSYKLE